MLVQCIDCPQDMQNLCRPHGLWLLYRVLQANGLVLASCCTYIAGSSISDVYDG